MAHYRPRFLEPYLTKLLAFSPIVGLFGHRQVGKTSLVERLNGSYVTFDRQSTIQAARMDPEMFLQGFRKFPAVIDECQYVPELFPALKEHVRLNKKPGQFLLTGSVRFSSKRDIRESLTGRIVTADLPPLGVGEILEDSTRRFAKALFSGDFGAIESAAQAGLADKSRFTKILSSFSKAKTLGGLPGVCFLRSEGLRSQRIDSQLETILERDLRLLINTSLSYTTLRRVLSLLSMKIGQPLNLAELGRLSRVSLPTLRRLIQAFEAMFLIELVPTEGDQAHTSLFFTDSGEAAHLSEGRLEEMTVLAQNLFCQVKSCFSGLAAERGHANDGHVSWFQFRTRGGSYVPIAFKNKNATIGMIPMHTDNPDASILASVRSFRKYAPESIVLLLHEGRKTEVLQSGVIVAPAAVVCS